MITAIELAAAMVLVIIGFGTVAAGRNLVKTLIGIEIMSKGVLLNFVASGYGPGHAMVVLLIIIDAIAIAVLMGVTVAVYRHNGSLDVEKLRRLTW